ncbi:MAG: leucyl/phenylalanyl-tRNA--protein transferase [Gammaproteobacteria bacterium]|nr:leucyl/phenylalanyl-tRNA--protein transferase [Gammaproteobacteria bacterium]
MNTLTDYEFPDPQTALVDPNGLLAVGGDLSPERLIAAYSQGIFPWFNEGEDIMWWSPDPRAVLFLDDLKISRSLTKVLRKGLFKLTFDQDFPAVIQQCAELRKNGAGTWITAEMIEAYCELHRQGIAHSVEVWQQNELVGGLYGLSIGKVFCGESMFSKVSNASKVGLIYLVTKLKQRDFILIDCQMPNPHLLNLGATTIPRQEFLNLLKFGLI